ncbi:MAG: hypothetical protein E7252_06135 [Lachnospira sp.]|nr:hypothetical protein [Lachnospira sp.]
MKKIKIILCIFVCALFVFLISKRQCISVNLETEESSTKPVGTLGFYIEIEEYTPTEKVEFKESVEEYSRSEVKGK